MPASSGSTLTDRSVFVKVAVIAGAVIAVAAAVWLGKLPAPFPIIELLLMIAAAAATRRFGLSLPGRGFSSFVLGVVLFSLLRHGWGWAALVAVLGMPAGDIPLRRLSLRAALANAGHLACGSAIVGVLYEGIGGRFGAAALAGANLGPLLVLLVTLPLFVNATFYLELTLSPALAWVDSRLTLRWEATVYVLSASIALGWLAVTRPGVPLVGAVVVSVLLAGATALAHWIAWMGVHADELRLVQGLSTAIAADVRLDRAFATIQSLTGRLVPYDAMGFWRYREAERELEVVADTAAGRPAGTRVEADRGELARVCATRHPVVVADRDAGLHADAYRSEIQIPLVQAQRLVGVWSIRHGDAGAFRESDAELLATLAPGLALTLRLDALVSPLVEASERTASYVEHLTATSQEIHAGSEEVTAATQRAESGAMQAAQLVTRAEQSMTELRTSAYDAAAAGEETLRASQQVEQTAQAVRAATSRTAAKLENIGATVEQSTREIERLREAAEAVGRFAETIASVANQTNMLALNATIEAARAGAHGAGFAVVADEVRRLAEASGAEAARAARTTGETRKVLDNAVQVLERMGTDLGEIVAAANAWIAQLESIVSASETAAGLSSRMVEFPRRNTAQADALHALLGEVRATAQASAAEAQAVAAAASQQLQAIESLSRSAIQLSASAEHLGQATRFIQE